MFSAKFGITNLVLCIAVFVHFSSVSATTERGSNEEINTTVDRTSSINSSPKRRLSIDFDKEKRTKEQIALENMEKKRRHSVDVINSIGTAIADGFKQVDGVVENKFPYLHKKIRSVERRNFYNAIAVFVLFASIFIITTYIYKFSNYEVPKIKEDTVQEAVAKVLTTIKDASIKNEASAYANIFTLLLLVLMIVAFFFLNRRKSIHTNKIRHVKIQ